MYSRLNTCLTVYKHFIYAYIDIDTSLNIPISKHRSAYYVCICACMHACL